MVGPHTIPFLPGYPHRHRHEQGALRRSGLDAAGATLARFAGSDAALTAQLSAALERKPGKLHTLCPWNYSGTQRSAPARCPGCGGSRSIDGHAASVEASISTPNGLSDRRIRCSGHPTLQGRGDARAQFSRRND